MSEQMTEGERAWMNKVIDGTDLYDAAIKRIQQLERLNAVLSAEIDRCRPVIEAAKAVADIGIGGWVQLREKVAAYGASGEGADG